jgi:hypothetical protein
VLSFADTPATRRAGELWPRYWEAAAAKGRFEDQPSLNRALQDAGCETQLLPAGYNAQFNFEPRSLRRAKVLHFLYVKGLPDPADATRFGRLVSRLFREGKLDEAELERLMRTGYPWADPDFVSAQWAAGRYAAAAVAGLRKLRRRAGAGG